MIRLSTGIWLLLAGGMLAGLFHMKYEVQDREAELRRLQREIVEHRESIDILRAEWSHLNNPDRLTRLNAQHLRLRPIDRERLLRGIEDAVRDDPIERVRHQIRSANGRRHE
jgi:hypothetical protein